MGVSASLPPCSQLLAVFLVLLLILLLVVLLVLLLLILVLILALITVLILAHKSRLLLMFLGTAKLVWPFLGHSCIYDLSFGLNSSAAK